MKVNLPLRIFITWLFGVLLFATYVRSQDVIRVETNLVQVPVIVTSRDGRYVPGLTKDNFQIIEDGKVQAIDGFSPVDEPITVYLMLDTSGSMVSYMSQLAQATGVFLNTLRPDDHIYLSIFADGQTVLLKNKKIADLLAKNLVLKIRPLDSRATYVYDAVDESIKTLMNTKGRKAIVLFSDALSDSHKVSAADSIRTAEEQDALIYTVRFGDVSIKPEWAAARGVQDQIARSGYSVLDQKGVEDIMPWWDIEATGDGKLKGGELADQIKRVKGYMDALAAKTGGNSFEIDKIDDLAEVFKLITLELRRHYTLSYYADPSTGPDKRKIQVKVNVPDAAVRAKKEIVIPHRP